MLTHVHSIYTLLELYGQMDKKYGKNVYLTRNFWVCNLICQKSHKYAKFSIAKYLIWQLMSYYINLLKTCELQCKLML